MAAPSGPLDELMFNNSDVVRFYIETAGMPFMHENMLHYYISCSPFFDWTSKNGLEIERSNTDTSLQSLIHDRRAFERHLASSSGVEYVLVEGENFEFDADGAPAGKGVWVVRKQERVKSEGLKGRGRDEVSVLGTYWIAGEQMFQAPSVYDVVNSRLLSASRAVHSLYRTASSLSRNTAASTKPATTTTTSRSASPGRSRQGSLAPQGEDPTTTTSLEPSTSSATTTDHLTSTPLLLASLSSHLNHRTDYTDENPLLGAPGNLTFSTSSAAVKKRKADEEEALRKAKEARNGTAGSGSGSGTATPTAASPFAVAKEKVGKEKEKEKERKKGREEKEKVRRRKSRHGGVGTPAATPRSAGVSAPGSGV